MSDLTHTVTDFFNNYRVKKYPKNEIIVQADNEPEGVYFVRSGRVAQYNISDKGQKVVVNVFKSNAFFPMSWAINRTPNKYFFEASVDCEIQIAPADEVLNFLKQNPDILLDLLSRVFRGADGLLARMTEQMSGNAGSRLVFELLNEYERFYNDDPNSPVSIKITEAELASRTGLARETVSREIQKLKNNNYISVNKGQILINDIDKFAQIIH